MAQLENVFSWSKSRDEQFRECQRKYYYDKYASWGGWDKSAPKEARLAYVLKNLKNRWAWKGETVHHVIENVLKAMRTGMKLPSETTYSLLTETMRKDYLSSKAKKYFDDPKKTVGLFEHEYVKPVTDSTWKETHDTALDCLKNFYGSALFADLAQDDKKNWLVIEDLEDFEFNGAKIYVKLDFARKKDGLIEIYDWKTGKDDSDLPAGRQAHAVQIGTYAIYAMKKWNVPMEDIRLYLFNLGTPNPVPKNQPLSKELLAETEKIMKESIAGMRKLLADPAKNVPLEVKHFAFTANERLCGYCNFYKMCEKYG